MLLSLSGITNSMKKFIILVYVFFIGVCAFAKGHNAFELCLGVEQSELVKHIGKPDIITQDYNNIQTWVYLNVKKLPVKSAITSEEIKKNKQEIILTVKFDNQDKISGYSYMTSYIGEKDD